MIPKPGKILGEVEAYWPVSLLPSTWKLFEKLILKHLEPITGERHLVPTHKFGFRKRSFNIQGASYHHYRKKMHKNKEVLGCLS
jgi:hypothetical protein